MKKTVIITSLIVLASCSTSKSTQNEIIDETITEEIVITNTVKINETKKCEEVIPIDTAITWLDFETAIDKNAKEKKFIFIDVYTNWCGWCKKMDASTFQNQEVIEYMNKHFYAVKMDAESKEPIAYKGVLYEYKQYNQKSGYNTLAVNLLDAKLSFPSFVILNKHEVKKGKIMGFKDAKTLLSLLKKYVGK